MTTHLEGPPRSDGLPGTTAGSALPDRIERLPILVLEPHSRCNCRCAMCDIWKAPGATSLDPAAVARVAQAWRSSGVERVVLSGGEPLMHPDLWAMVAPLAQAGMGVTLVTTGLLLGRYAADLVQWVDDIVVSLDGPEAVHDGIRGIPGAYGKLAAGVAEVRRVAGELPGPRMTARCTLQRANCASVPETVLAARDLGMDGISFLAVDATSEAFNRPGGWDAARKEGVAPGRTELAQFEAGLSAVEALRNALGPNFIAESPAKLAGLADVFRAYLGDAQFPEARCNAPWVSAVVEPDGTVRPCFFHQPIGKWDPSDEGGSTLMDAVNSSQAIAFRASLDVATNPVCRRCTCRLNLASRDDSRVAGG